MHSVDAPLLERSNTLKEAADSDLLTSAQRDVAATIREHRDAGEQFINLYGPEAAGKTFLCWVLALEEEWGYHQALPDEGAVETPVVVYDHGTLTRRATRQLRNHVAVAGVSCAIYVTDGQTAAEVYPRVELAPDSAHYETVHENWAALDLDTADAPTATYTTDT